MNNTSRSILVFTFLALIFPGLSLSGEQLNKDSLEKLIKGNSAEGKKITWNTTYKMYFDPSGKFSRIDSLNNKEGGEWKVENDGTLVMSGRKEKRRTVSQRSDGGYDVHNRAGDVIWTMDKITSGNPYNLVPE